MVFTRSQKEIKLFTWMSSDQDSFSKPRMRPGSCQQCTRSAWTITALLLQAFLQQGDTKQFLSALWWPKPLCLHGNPTSGQTTSCLCGCQTTHPRATVGAGCRPQPSSFLHAPHLGAVGKLRRAVTSLYGHGQTETVKGPKLQVSTSAFLPDSKDSAWLLGSLDCSAAHVPEATGRCHSHVAAQRQPRASAKPTGRGSPHRYVAHQTAPRRTALAHK